MAITELHYRVGDPQSAQFDERRRGSYTLRFVARTNNGMGAEDVLTDSQEDDWAASVPVKGGTARTVKVPKMFCRYEYGGIGAAASSYDDHSVCKDIALDQVATLADGGQKWSIVANYRPKETNESDSDAATTPVDRPAKVTFDRETFREEVQHGTPSLPPASAGEEGGTPRQASEDGGEVEIRTTAGGLYESPVEVIRTRSVIVVTYNVGDLKVASDAVTKYQGSINTEGYTIHTKPGGDAKDTIQVAAGTGLTREVVVSEQQTEGSHSFYRVTFRIAVEPERWIHRAVERGRQHIQHGEGSDESGNPTPADIIQESEYVTLNRDGSIVEIDDDGNLPATVTTEWVVYRQVNYSGLPWTKAPPTHTQTC